MKSGTDAQEKGGVPGHLPKPRIKWLGISFLNLGRQTQSRLQTICGCVGPWVVGFCASRHFCRPFRRQPRRVLVQDVRSWVGLSDRASVFGILRIHRRESGGGLLALLLSSHLEPRTRYSVFTDTKSKIKNPQPVHHQLKAVPINTVLEAVAKIEPSRPFLLFAGGSSDFKE